VRDLPLGRKDPPVLFLIVRFAFAAVPPVVRAEIFWKRVGTGELSLPRGATSFNHPASPAVPKAPPGTCVPVEELWKWRKLVITDPIAIHPTGFPNFVRNF
jgi:hypothetical protein